MAITLDSIALPDDLVWVDEFAYTPVIQELAWAVDGTLIIQQGIKLAGRTITLSGGENYGWITRATLLLVHAKAIAGVTCTLTLSDSRVFSVKFRQDNPLEAHPVLDYASPDASDFYYITLPFIEV
jgi:hypothetical protein